MDHLTNVCGSYPFDDVRKKTETSKNQKMKELQRIAFLEMPTEHEAKHYKVVACGAKIDYTYIASYYLCEALKVVSRGTQYQDICKKIVEAAEKIIEDEGC